MKKSKLLALLCAVVLLGGCASEQTLVKKVNEPGSLDAQERLLPVTLPWEDADIVTLAPDNQTALLMQSGQPSAYRNGQVKALALPLDREAVADAAERMIWSPNCRYACYLTEAACTAMDLDKGEVRAYAPVQTACFNANQVTLYYAKATEGGSQLYRRKLMSDEAEEWLLDVPCTLHGAMYRTTKNQYLVMGDNKLLCLEQVNAGQPWSIRVVADFGPSGMRITDFSYSAQTALCIVSGMTQEKRMVFSVVSPDGEDFAIDQVSCFSPVAETPVRNVPAQELSRLLDTAAYPVALERVQLSPGGLYLLLWGKATDGGEKMFVLNLDKGDLSEVIPETELCMRPLTQVRWCAGKTLLLTDDQGCTRLASLTGWDD